MNIKGNRVLAVSIAALGISSGAHATQYPVTLNAWSQYSPNGSTGATLTGSTLTGWTYDDVSNVVSSPAGGTLKGLFKVTPTNPLDTDTLAGGVSFSTAGGAATAGSFSCTEGKFGAGVGVSICGNYNFGMNFYDESTASWGPGTAFSRTLGGDDVAIGPPQNLHQLLDGLTLVSFNSNPGGSLIIANTNSNGNFALATSGNRFTFLVGAGVDAVPDPFTFTDVTGVGLSRLQTSNCVQITGINVPVSISVTGGDYLVSSSASCTGDLLAPGTISNGQYIQVRHTSSPSNGGVVNTTLTIGGVSDTFTSTTATDTTPDAFSFTDLIQQPLGPAAVSSDCVQIMGINGPAAISVTGGEYSVPQLGSCSASYTSAPMTISNLQWVRVRQTTASTYGTQVNTQLTVGGVTGVFYTVTQLADPVVVTATAAPAPAPVILFPQSQNAQTNQAIGLEANAVTTSGAAAIGFCKAIDPRETEGQGGTFNPRPLALSELSAACPSLAGQTLLVPAYMRAIKDMSGVPYLLFSTATTATDFQGVAVSNNYPTSLVTYTGGAGVSPPCSGSGSGSASLSSRPLWLWGERVGENVSAILTNENQVMKPVSIQCDASRSGTGKVSNFIQNVFLDENLYSSATHLAGQNNDLDTILAKLAADASSCGASQLLADTTAMQTYEASCRKATVFPIVTVDTSVAPVRIDRTHYQYAMKVKLRNYGGPVLASQAVIRSGVTGTVVTGGVLTKVFGAIPAGGAGYAETPAQSFTIQQDRLGLVDPGVVMPAVTFTPDLSGPNATRYTAAQTACENVARVAKNNLPDFQSCPVADAKKYRGTLIGAGLGAAFTIWDRFEHPNTPGWVIYPLPTDIIPPAQIPPDQP